jgi:hypothetical protein
MRRISEGISMIMFERPSFTLGNKLLFFSPVRRPLTRLRATCCDHRQIQKSGVSSLRGVAKALSARGIKTARGGEWTAVQVSEILRRA